MKTQNTIFNLKQNSNMRFHNRFILANKNRHNLEDNTNKDKKLLNKALYCNTNLSNTNQGKNSFQSSNSNSSSKKKCKEKSSNNNLYLSNINYYPNSTNDNSIKNLCSTTLPKINLRNTRKSTSLQKTDIDSGYNFANINTNNERGLVSNNKSYCSKSVIKNNIRSFTMYNINNEKEKESEIFGSKKPVNYITKNKNAISFNDGNQSSNVINSGYNNKANFNSKDSIPLLPAKNISDFTSINKITIISKNIVSLNSILNEKFNLYQEAKHSSSSFDIISAYGVNTYKGIIRNYNEDRVSILVNYENENTDSCKKIWPKISYFAIYDGHAGNKCSDYLKNFLHLYILNSKEFPEDPINAIAKGFKACEISFLKSIHEKTNNEYNDFSGSCAIIVLIINDICYTINLGDSRALYSYEDGNKFYQLSRDQKPNDPIEKNRIYKAGGAIFKSKLVKVGVNFNKRESDFGFKVPFRISPGKLSVSIH